MPPPTEADRRFAEYVDALVQGIIIGGLCGLCAGVFICSFFG